MTTETKTDGERQLSTAWTDTTTWNGEEVLEIETYDTTKPIDTITGKPPVKSRLKRARKVTENRGSRSTIRAETKETINQATGVTSKSWQKQKEESKAKTDSTPTLLIIIVEALCLGLLITYRLSK